MAVLCLFLISLSSVTAIDNNTDNLVPITDNSDNIDIIDVKTSDNSVVVAIDEKNVTVKNSTFNDYFNANGTIKSNITAEEIIFEGEFSDISINITRPVKLISNDATLINSTIEINAANVEINGFKFNTALENLITIMNNNVTVFNNSFIQLSKSNKNILIKAENCEDISILDNVISMEINNGGAENSGVIYLKQVENAVVSNNTIDAKLPSAPNVYVGWTANYASYIIQVAGDNGVISENKINYEFNDVTSPVYDSIYAIIVSGDDSKVSKNVVKGFGNNYTYGITASGSNVLVTENNITLGSKYAGNGISLNAPFEGVISKNNVNITTPAVAYGTNDYGDISATYENNTFILTSNSVYGLELMGEVKENVTNNKIIANGNYTIAIAVSMMEGDLNIENNIIVIDGKGLGNATTGDMIPSMNVAIYLAGAMDSTNVAKNKITANIPSKPWGTTVAGFVISASDVVLKDNDIKVIVNNATGAYNSIYAIKNTGDNLVLQNNNITVDCNVNVDYAYGMTISGDDVLIDGNNVTVLNNKGYYANAIDLSTMGASSFSGIISNNNLKTSSINVAYGITSFGDVVATYDNNEIIANSNSVYAIEAAGSNETIINNKITVTGNYTLGIVVAGNDEIANIKNNKITVTGQGLGNATTGDSITSINAGIWITNKVESANITGNTINANIPSASWDFKQAGLIIEAGDVLASKNKINVTATNVVGSYDSLYAVKISADDVKFINNNITANGPNYVYGIDVSGEDLAINANNIEITSLNYGNGINVNCPTIGEINDNNIKVNSKESAYGTVSSSWGSGQVKVNYTNNKVDLDSNTAYGLELSGHEENAINNTITVNGNYTMGIATSAGAVQIINNTIESNGVGKTNVPTMDMFGATNQGILIKDNTTTATIVGNNIKTTGNYTVNVLSSKNNVSTVKNNYLIANSLCGDESVNNITGVVANNTPSGIIKIESESFTKYFQNGTNWTATLTDNKGNPISGVKLTFNVNGQDYNRTTNANGTASMKIDLPAGIYNVSVRYVGNDTYGNVSKNITITVLSRIEANDIVKMFANATQFDVKILDDQGKPLEGAKISFNINGVFYNRTTKANGTAVLPINLPARNYEITIKCGNEVTSRNVTVLPILVENNNFTKYYKNATQYTLKALDANGKALANATITYNINGQMYTRKTNENGTATMQINLPPGEYVITATYNGFSVSNTVNVLNVVESENIEMVDSKRIPFVATVLDGQGKPLANASLSFNINGIFYNRTSDVNGSAKLDINLPVGKYIITTIFNGLQVGNNVTIVKD